MSAEQAPSRRVLIIGAGIMGTAAARALKREGFSVTVLEKAVPGAEASSAAAGILGPEIETERPGPMRDLCRYSWQLYPNWIRELEAETHLSTGFGQTGSLEVEVTGADLDGKARLRSDQLEAGLGARLSPEQLQGLEPHLSKDFAGALYFRSDGHITPPHLYRANYIAAEKAGVHFLTGASVRALEFSQGPGRRCTGVVLDDGTVLQAELTVVAAGSWTQLIGNLPVSGPTVVPARGQIVELDPGRPLLERVIFGAGVYLIPRRDGRILIGSTLEFVGYRKGVTAAGVSKLLGGALRLIPALKEAEVTGSWSNFRPYTADERPLLGWAAEGLLVASGHYRTGILLSPGTAEIIADLAMGRPPALELSPFDPQRKAAG